MPKISKCYICENDFEHEDMAFCPAYKGPICSLCCSLDVRCGDLCRPDATLSKQAQHFFSRFLSTKLLRAMTTPMAQFISVTLGLSFIGAGILVLIYLQVPLNGDVKEVFASTLVKIFFLLMIIIGIISWLFILARSGNNIALKELRSQTNALAKEINAHEKTSQALQDAKDIAETANQAKSRYLAGISHELRTPLNVMLGYAQLLSQDEKLPVRQRETLGIVRRNGEHLADLIEGLLEISKIEAGRLTLHRDEFNFKAVLQQVVDMFHMQATQKGIKFYYHFDEHLPDFVVTDKQRFRQILINLISNAIKYTEKGSVTFKVNYRSQVASFSVEDTGVGIAEENQQLIFQPFEQIRNSHTRAIGGTGLGLTISRSLTELMGGDLSLASQLGKGSTFNLRLMLPKIHHDDKTPEQEDKHAIGYDGERKTILVIDDDINQHRLMNDLLMPLGFKVLKALDAEQGFSLLGQHKVDFITLDVRMPNIDGWQMVKMLREQKYTLPVLMVSANARDNEINLAAKGYHDGYMAKPVNLDALLGKIGQLLNLQWQYKIECSSEFVLTGEEALKPLVNIEQYSELTALAEIGYLSGFNDKVAEIELTNNFPADVKSQISEYIELCNFPKIIQYLGELNHEK